MTEDANGGMTLAAILQGPFPPGKVKSYEGAGKKVFHYIDHTDTEDRLDEAFGPDGWGCEMEVIEESSKAVKCTITVLTDRGPVSKSDFGYPNSARDADNDAAEPLKAAASEAFKRAGCKWGVARDLYRRSGGQAPAARREQNQASRPPANRPAAEPPRPQAAAPASPTAGVTGITPVQSTTIAKLLRLLGRPVDDAAIAALSKVEAGPYISDLSREYNERKAAGGAS